MVRQEGCYSQLGKSKQLKYELKNRVFAPSSKILATKVMNATTNACTDALDSKRLKIGNINSPFFLVRCHWCLRNGRLAFCGLLENQLLTRQRGRNSKCDLMVSRSTQEYKASILLVLLLCICVCFLQCCSHRFVNRSAAFSESRWLCTPTHFVAIRVSSTFTDSLACPQVPREFSLARSLLSPHLGYLKACPSI